MFWTTTVSSPFAIKISNLPIVCKDARTNSGLDPPLIFGERGRARAETSASTSRASDRRAAPHGLQSENVCGRAVSCRGLPPRGAYSTMAECDGEARSHQVRRPPDEPFQNTIGDDKRTTGPVSREELRQYVPPSCRPPRSTRGIAGHIRPRSRQTCFSEADDGPRSLPLLDSRGRHGPAGVGKNGILILPPRSRRRQDPWGPAVIPIVGPCVVPAFRATASCQGLGGLRRTRAGDCVLHG